MRKAFATIALLILAAPASGKAQEQPGQGPGGADCYQRDEIRVTAWKFAEDPPSYSFRIVNGSDFPAFSMTLGGDPGLFSIYRATNIGSPQGWTGQTLRSYERGHIRYVWRPNIPPDENISESPHLIQPGQTLSGFSVQLPPWGYDYTVTNDTAELIRMPLQPDGRLRLGDDIVSEQDVDLRFIPFTVRLSGGDCRIGHVQPDGF